MNVYILILIGIDIIFLLIGILKINKQNNIINKQDIKIDNLNTRIGNLYKELYKYKTVIKTQQKDIDSLKKKNN